MDFCYLTTLGLGAFFREILSNVSNFNICSICENQQVVIVNEEINLCPATHHPPLFGRYHIVRPARHKSVGAFSSVFLLHDYDPCTILILKIIKKEYSVILHNEHRILSQLWCHTKRIPRTFGYFSSRCFEYLVQEALLPLPSLSTCKDYRSKQDFLRILLLDILSLLKVMHDADLVHGDIKPDNILYRGTPFARYRFQLIDFGNSLSKEQLLDTKSHQFELGHVKFRAPEILSRSPKLTEKIDIWSVGRSIVELCSAGSGLNSDKVNEKHRRWWIARQCSINDPWFVDLIDSMLHFDPLKRLSTTQALSHKFFIM